MHHYPFHPGDYLLDTAHLEPMEDLAFRRLIDFYYITEAPIPLETESVSRRLRLGLELVSKVLDEFFERREDGWHQSRCDAEIAQYRALVERARHNGKRGGRPKGIGDEGEKPSRFQVGFQNKPNPNPDETHSKANQEPRTKNQEPNIVLPFASPQFAEAWSRWTKHRSELKKKLTPTAIAQQLAKMAEIGEERSIAMIEHSIANGWIGLFENSAKQEQTKRKYVPCC